MNPSAGILESFTKLKSWLDAVVAEAPMWSSFRCDVCQLSSTVISGAMNNVPYLRPSDRPARSSAHVHGESVLAPSSASHLLFVQHSFFSSQGKTRIQHQDSWESPGKTKDSAPDGNRRRHLGAAAFILDPTIIVTTVQDCVRRYVHPSINMHLRRHEHGHGITGQKGILGLN